ncbi:hypothetical protein P4S68_03860 [Pseudoalteromonas sp. Hal099]
MTPYQAPRYLGNPNDGDTQVYSRGHQITLNHDINDEWSLVAGANYRSSTLTGFSSDAELSPSRQSLFDDGRTLTPPAALSRLRSRRFKC